MDHHTLRNPVLGDAVGRGWCAPRSKDLSAKLSSGNLRIFSFKVTAPATGSKYTTSKSRTGFIWQHLFGFCVSFRTLSSGTGQCWRCLSSYQSWSKRGAWPWWVSFSKPEEKQESACYTITVMPLTCTYKEIKQIGRITATTWDDKSHHKLLSHGHTILSRLNTTSAV